MSFTYDYPRPTVTVDCIVFRRIKEEQFILLIRRLNEPFKGYWAIPGGFVDIDESLDAAAERELKEETGIENIRLQQFYTFGDPLRDPRHRTISVAYAGFDELNQTVSAGDDAADAEWFNLKELPLLAFDHQKIIEKAIEKFLNHYKI